MLTFLFLVLARTLPCCCGLRISFSLVSTVRCSLILTFLSLVLARTFHCCRSLRISFSVISFRCSLIFTFLSLVLPRTSSCFCGLGLLVLVEAVRHDAEND